MSLRSLFRRRPAPRSVSMPSPISCEVGRSDNRPELIEMSFAWPDATHRYHMTDEGARRMVRLLIATLQTPLPIPDRSPEDRP